MSASGIKKLPYNATKGKIYKMYNSIPTRHLRNDINEIIQNHRGIPLKEAKKVKTLYREEFLKVLQSLDIPNGYEPINNTVAHG